MHVLFVHQNFPAQFRYLAPRLATECGWRCTFATCNHRTEKIAHIDRIIYRPRHGATARHHPLARPFANAIGEAHAAYDALKNRPDVRPDLVVGHSAFGSTLFLPHLYDAPVINFFEYFYHVVGQDRLPGGRDGNRTERPPRSDIKRDDVARSREL